MEKIYLWACIFVTHVIVTFAAVAIVPSNPDYPGKCYYSETGVMEPGQEMYLSECRKATCENSGEIQIFSCGVVAIEGKKCVLVQDLKKNYPDCCPQPKCC